MPKRGRSGPRLIALEGLSGAGKTTLGRLLEHRNGWKFIPEAFRQLRPRPSLRYAGRGELLDLELRLLEQESRRFAKARSLGSSPVLLDTGFLGPLTYAWGLRRLRSQPDVFVDLRERATELILGGRLGMPDLTVYLDVPVPEARRRARLAAESHPEEFVSRHLRVGAYERRLWSERFHPILGSRLLWLDGLAPVGRLAEKVERFWRAEGREARPDLSRAARVLVAMDPFRSP